MLNAGGRVRLSLRYEEKDFPLAFFLACKLSMYAFVSGGAAARTAVSRSRCSSTLNLILSPTTASWRRFIALTMPTSAALISASATAIEDGAHGSPRGLPVRILTLRHPCVESRLT